MTQVLLALGAGAIIAVLAGVGAAYVKGRGDGRKKQEGKDAKAYRDTRQRMDGVDRIDDAADARERMRQRDPDQR